ncbi:hypothetical protein HYH03_008649 [Edaphochlamys debaryana]|uniref:non-specific serine/threonine protein kinase n=1 Tax=Edaphochlamys debaryana TaxID=47281 RepID=A0A835XZP3_9CHLO|nr:hypothetical protein HYH03_008649 [Edaphochlamys debaryana]|eukprot:KAG2493233.1 hypothetical protein HYH03_008649 [Edaphochlamys debaryana]
MSSEDYAPIRQIGKGAFGTAHIVQHKVTGERFVLKRVRLARQSAKERQFSVRELLLLSNLRHRNVLDFKGCWVEGGCNLCLLVELCESGDLFTQLRLRGQGPAGVHFSEEHLQEMAVQLLSAMAYLHRSCIVHRDLKSSNILITGEGCLKLADFGLSAVLGPDTGGMTKTVVGTPNYMSPCVLQEKPYGAPNDIWGLGCVLYEVSALKPAFQAFNMAGLIKKVASGPLPQLPSCYSEQWRGLVRSMLTREPEARPTAAQLLELDWLQPAVRRVEARFGPELPPGAPELLERLADLPPDIMGLLSSFQAQERDEKRRADEAKERRRAAAAKWDPLVRAAQGPAPAAKLPPLQPHRARKPAPRRPGGAVDALPLVPPRAAAGSPVNGAPAGAAAGLGARRKTYHGDGARVNSGGNGRPAAARLGGAAGGAGLRPAEVVVAAAGQPARPSSAPPDSPVRRSHMGGPGPEEGEGEGSDGGAGGEASGGSGGGAAWDGGRALGLGGEASEAGLALGLGPEPSDGDAVWGLACPTAPAEKGQEERVFSRLASQAGPPEALRDARGSASSGGALAGGDGGGSGGGSGGGAAVDTSAELGVRHSCPAVPLPVRALSAARLEPLAPAAPSALQPTAASKRAPEPPAAAPEPPKVSSQAPAVAPSVAASPEAPAAAASRPAPDAPEPAAGSGTEPPTATPAAPAPAPAAGPAKAPPVRAATGPPVIGVPTPRTASASRAALAPPSPARAASSLTPRPAATAAKPAAGAQAPKPPPPLAKVPAAAGAPRAAPSPRPSTADRGRSAGAPPGSAPAAPPAARDLARKSTGSIAAAAGGAPGGKAAGTGEAASAAAAPTAAAAAAAGPRPEVGSARPPSAVAGVRRSGVSITAPTVVSAARASPRATPTAVGAGAASRPRSAIGTGPGSRPGSAKPVATGAATGARSGSSTALEAAGSRRAVPPRAEAAPAGSRPGTAGAARKP